MMVRTPSVRSVDGLSRRHTGCKERTAVLMKWSFLSAVSFAWFFPCCAQSVIEFGSRLGGGSWNGPDQVVEWEFMARDSVSAVQLGLFDGHSQGGFLQRHEVGLWDSTGNLLVSAIIDPGESAPLIGNFRFVEIPPVRLVAGQTYIVGAFMPGLVVDYSYLFSPYNAAFYGLRIDPRIQFVAQRYSLANGAITFPTDRIVDGNIGAFGPNLIIDVPEPRIFAFVALACLVIMYRQRRPRSYPVESVGDERRSGSEIIPETRFGATGRMSRRIPR